MTSAGGSIAPRGRNPWLIAFVVSIATFMEVLDVSVANVALQHIAGSMAASIDQATWILTSYLVANAVILPLSGWLSGVMGRKRFYMLCVALFTFSSLLCGMAWSLGSLVFFRVLQGLGGGGLAPSEQATLADAFPPEKRGQAFALYGVAVVVAPTIGPTLGGFITDHATWHWIFFINVPIGLLSLFLVSLIVPSQPVREKQSRGFRVDFVGFALVALALGSLEVVLDEGQRNDWFGSNLIIAFSLMAALAFLILIPWELTRKDPVVDLRMICRRQFGTCFALMLLVGGIIFSTLQMLPQLVQEQFGYTATLAGLSLSPGGLATMMMMPVAGYLTGKMQARFLIAFGLIIVAFSMWHLTGLNGDITFSYAAWARIYTAVGLPFLFLPITTASYAGLNPRETDQAAGLINFARNLGGSIGVAFVQTMLQQRQQFHQSRLVEHILPTSTAFQEALHRAVDLFVKGGYSTVDASRHAYALIGRTIAKQATLLAFIDTFWLLAMLCALALPFAFVLRPARVGTQAAHAPC